MLTWLHISRLSPLSSIMVVTRCARLAADALRMWPVVASSNTLRETRLGVMTYVPTAGCRWRRRLGGRGGLIAIFAEEVVEERVSRLLHAAGLLRRRRCAVQSAVGDGGGVAAGLLGR